MVKKKYRKSKIYKLSAYVAVMAIVLQALYPIIPFLPSFKVLQENVVSANDNILAAGDTEKVMFENTNPEFKVQFGDKEQQDKPFVRFEALGTGDNPFGKAKDQTITEKVYERLQNAIYGEKKHGIEFSMTGADTNFFIGPQGEEPKKEENPKSEIPKINIQNSNINENANINENQNQNKNENINLNSNINKNENKNSNENSNENINENNNKNSNSNANSNKNSNSNSNENSNENKNDNSGKLKPLSLNTPSLIDELSKKATANSNQNNTNDNKNLVSSQSTQETDESALEVQAELQAEQQIYDELNDQLDKMIKDANYEPPEEDINKKREDLKQNILAGLLKQQEASAPTQTAKIEDPRDKTRMKDVIKNPDVVPGVDAQYSILEEKGMKEDIVIRSNDGFTKDCMQKLVKGDKMDCSLPKNEFTYDLKLDPGVVMKHAIGVTNGQPQGVTYFEDENGKYLFHFLPLFAVDGQGIKTNAVQLEITPKQESGEYTMKVIVDLSWLMDHSRLYPVRIDPSILHDTEAEFDAGSSLIKLESIAGPKVDILAPTEFGNGADGACSVGAGTSVNLNTSSCSGRGSADAVKNYTTANTAAGQNQIALNSAANFAAGDEVLIINLQGTAGKAGQYETKRIVSISTNTLTLNGNLKYAYDGTTQKIMVQRVPNYTTVSVASTGTLTASAWDGTNGGVVFFRATGTVSNIGTITTASLGFRGGGNNTSGPEGYTGYSATGGGVGGGGGNGSLIASNGCGGYTCTTEATGGGNGTNNSGGGGGGGHDSSACSSNTSGGSGGSIGGGGGGGRVDGGAGNSNGNGGSGTAINSGENGGGGGGGGGAPYSALANNSNLSSGLLQLGGGAAAGAAGGSAGNDRSGGGGGNQYSANTGNPGGGIIYISGYKLNLAGTTTASGGTGGAGTAGANSATSYTGGGGGGGGGNGGAGGTVILRGITVDLGTITASGGSGGGAGAAGSGNNGGGNGGAGSAGSTGSSGAVGIYYQKAVTGSSTPAATVSKVQNFGSDYGDYTSSVLNLSSSVSSIDSLQWAENGVKTADGQTLYSSTNLTAQWNFDDNSGVNATDSSGNSHTGTLTGFSDTSGQDVVAGSGWTANNGKWPRSAPEGLMFDGVDDYVSAATSADWDLGTTWTMEAWVRPTSYNATYNTIFSRVIDGSNYFQVFLNGSGQIKISTNTEGDQTWTGAAIPIGQWSLISISSSSGTTTVYINGKSIGSSTVTIPSGTAEIKIGWDSNASRQFKGVMDSFRIYKGRALGANEILSNYAAGDIEFLTRTGADNTPDDGSWDAEGWKPVTSETQVASMDADQANWSPDYGNSYTKLLLHADGANNSTIFTDSSVNPHQVTPYGNTKISTTQSQFGGASAYLDGSGDYLSLPDIDELNLAANDFTIDFWVRFDDISSHRLMFSTNNNGGGGSDASNYVIIMLRSDTGLDVDLMSGGVEKRYLQGSTTGWSATTWYHIAVARQGNTVYVFRGGTQMGTIDVTGFSLPDNNTNEIGRWMWAGSPNYQFAGYIDEFRISKGVARWTSGFTAPAAAYNPLSDANESLTWWTAKNNESNIKMEGAGSMKLTTGAPQVDGNTVGLWHMDETGGSGAYIKDASASGYNGTPTGTTLSEGMYGKSRTFNGSSDFIGVGTYTPTNNITYEAWVKWTALPGINTSQTIYANAAADGYSANLFYEYNNGGTHQLAYAVPTDASNYRYWSGTYAFQTDTWYHVAATQSTPTGTPSLYVNGVSLSVGSLSALGTPTRSNAAGSIGRAGGANSNYFNGVIDEVRISNTVRSAEEIYEDYRMGRDHRISKTIASSDLSSKTKLPFWVAGDRAGNYLEATFGESAYANYETDANTTGFWHLEEQSGSAAYIKDSSSSGYNGTPTGTTFADGKIGKGRSFNGSSDYIGCGTFTPTADLTYDAWIKLTSLPAVGEVKVIFGNQGASWYNNQSVVYIQNSAGTYYLVYGVASDGSNYRYWGPSSFNPVADTWYHIAITQSGATGTPTIYLNGVSVPISLLATLGTPTRTSAAFSIGRAGDQNANYFLGVVDELRISNSVRTAGDIRAAYESGLRTHPITIDFQAKLDGGNLIADTSDTSFTVDARPYTSSTMCNSGTTLCYVDTLFKGDKIIVKENYDGTEYIAQGTVNSVNNQTGAVTVSAWDAGSTAPASGFTANASVFKWQREWMDVTAPLASQEDATVRLTLRCTDGSVGENVYLDDFRYGGPYLSDPAASGNVTSTVQRYMQYRALFSSTDPNVTPYLSGVTVNYTAGPTTDQLMRHGRWFSSNVIQPFWWAQ